MVESFVGALTSFLHSSPWCKPMLLPKNYHIGQLQTSMCASVWQHISAASIVSEGGKPLRRVPICHKTAIGNQSVVFTTNKCTINHRDRTVTSAPKLFAFSFANSSIDSCANIYCIT
ncbi:hypothetical protein CW304_23480 [Bacillus sp. UFRGS-B20]|nr:hypothetical protein CW304_23480 [Bacillus sp. UFRGS-B20]